MLGNWLAFGGIVLGATGENVGIERRIIAVDRAFGEVDSKIDWIRIIVVFNFIHF